MAFLRRQSWPGPAANFIVPLGLAFLRRPPRESGILEIPSSSGMASPRRIGAALGVVIRGTVSEDNIAISDE